jgi:hypothetical protein
MLRKCLQALVIVAAIAPCHARSFSDVMPDDIDCYREIGTLGPELRQSVWKHIIKPTLVPLHIAADVASLVIENSTPVTALRLGTLAGMITLPEYYNPLSIFAFIAHFHADYNLSFPETDFSNDSYYQALGLISGGYLIADYYYRVSPMILNNLARLKNSIFVPVHLDED